MNPETLLAIIGCLMLGGLSAEALLRLKHPMANALVLNLTLVAGSGVLMAMGGLELAGRYGYTLVIAMIAFTLIFLFSPLIFFPLRRLVEVIKFATLVDFLTFRYRGRKNDLRMPCGGINTTFSRAIFCAALNP